MIDANPFTTTDRGSALRQKKPTNVYVRMLNFHRNVLFSIIETWIACLLNPYSLLPSQIIVFIEPVTMHSGIALFCAGYIIMLPILSSPMMA